MLQERVKISAEKLAKYLQQHRLENVKRLSDALNNFGEVLLVRDDKKNEFALKIIPKEDFRKGDFLIASQLKNPHIIETFTKDEYEGFVLILSEFVRDGTLTDWIKTQKTQGKPPNAEIATTIIQQLLTAIEYMHYKCSAMILHRDVKSANILFKGVPKPGAPNSGVISKLCDFGLMREVRSFRPTTPCGTAAYKAPEIQLMGAVTGAYDEKVDCWSAGVILYEMCAFGMPYTNVGVTSRDLLKPIDRPETMAGPQWETLWKLMQGLLAFKPEDRLTSTNALKLLGGPSKLAMEKIPTPSPTAIPTPKSIATCKAVMALPRLNDHTLSNMEIADLILALTEVVPPITKQEFEEEFERRTGKAPTPEQASRYCRIAGIAESAPPLGFIGNMQAKK